MRFKELLQAAEKISILAEIRNRRRPGRDNQVNPHLIIMLRNPTAMDVPTAPLSKVDTQCLQDDLAPTKGVVFALVLSAPLWAIISTIIWIVVR